MSHKLRVLTVLAQEGETDAFWAQNWDLNYVMVLQQCSWRGDGGLWALIDFETFSILKVRT